MSPNSSISSSNGIRFLTGFVAAAGFLLLLGTGLSLYLGAPSGDLIRIGRLASIDWKPRHAQSSLDRAANPPAGTPDLLVLGDSFSADNLWQSELGRAGRLTTLTWHYKDIACIDNWLRAAISDRSPHASPVIIIESIEREFVSRFSTPQENCRAHPGKPLAVKAGKIETDENESGIFPMDIRYVVAAAINHFSAAKNTGRVESRTAVAVDLTTDRLFSSLRRSRLSYFQGDDRKWQGWTAGRQQAAVNYLVQMQALAAQQHKQLFVVIIPDKSTVYEPWVKPQQLPARPQPDLFPMLANALGNDSNYLPALRLGADTMVDLYRPDDTHLSLDGYRLLAREIATRTRLQH